MSTFASDWISEVKQRESEVRLLVDHARQHVVSNKDLFDALCRSSTVMLYAHFEGALKSAIRSYAADINRNGGYALAKGGIKKIYLASLLGQSGKDADSKESNDRRQRLDAVLAPLQGVEVDLSDVWSGNKNPTAETYRLVCQKFGFQDIFRQLEGSELEEVMFSGTPVEKQQKLQDLESNFISTTSSYPYMIDWSLVGKRVNLQKSKSTIYQDFLNNTMKPRHDIAHGDALTSLLNADEIEDALIKLKALKIVFYMAISS